MGNWVSRLTNKSITTTLEIHHLCTKNATEQIIQNILLPIIRELMCGITFPHNIRKSNSMVLSKKL
jgi:hypothetical protein